jgi:polysaccharide pyruvyl transferase WcaK-like protein
LTSPSRRRAPRAKAKAASTPRASAELRALRQALADERAARARVEDALTEALEQRTAASEILGVISRSPSDAQPVFQAIVAHAARLCDAAFSAVARFDGALLQLVAVNNMSPEETAAYHSPATTPGPGPC